MFSGGFSKASRKHLLEGLGISTPKGTKTPVEPMENTRVWGYLKPTVSVFLRVISASLKPSVLGAPGMYGIITVCSFA